MGLCVGCEREHWGTIPSVSYDSEGHAQCLSESFHPCMVGGVYWFAWWSIISEAFRDMSWWAKWLLVWLEKGW
jgi:hypothetical protein